LQMPNPCAEEPIRRFYVSDDIGTRVSDYQCRKQSEATQDSAALLRSMTRKDEWHYSQGSVGVGKSGKRNEPTRELCKRLGHPRSRLRRKTYPPPKASQVFFPPLLLSRSRWVSSGLASLIFEMTPPQHTHIERRHHPRSITADLVIWYSGNLPGSAPKPSANTRLGGSPEPNVLLLRPVVYCCRVCMG